MTKASHELPSTSANGAARARALAGEPQHEFTPTSLVNFLSQGRLLIVGEDSDCLAMAAALRDAAGVPVTECRAHMCIV